MAACRDGDVAALSGCVPCQLLLAQAATTFSHLNQVVLGPTMIYLNQWGIRWPRFVALALKMHYQLLSEVR